MARVLSCTVKCAKLCFQASIFSSQFGSLQMEMHFQLAQQMLAQGGGKWQPAMKSGIC